MGEVQQAVRADVAEGGECEHREDFVFGDGVLQALDDMLGRQGAFGKELLHQRIVALGHHLNQLFVGELSGFALFSGNLALLADTVAVGLVEVSLHRDEVDDAPKAFFAADR